MPPGPSVLVRFLSDMKALNSGIDSTASTSESASGRIHSAFSTTLSQLNQTGVLGPFGTALETANNSMDNLGQKGASAGTKLMGVGGIALGVGVALQAMGSKEQAASQQLTTAIDNTGHSYDEYAGKIEAAVKTQERYGNSAADTKRALQILTQATGDPAKALQYLGTASDLAAAKHESLDTAAGQLGKTYNGTARLLKEFGITAEKASTSQNALKQATKESLAADAGLQKAIAAQTALHEKLAGKTTLTAAEQQSLAKADGAVQTASDKAAAAHANLDKAQQNVKTSAQVGADTMGKLGDKLKGQASAGADTFSGKLKGMKAKLEDAVSTFGQKYGPAITIAGAALTGLGSAIEIAKSAQAAWNGVTKAGAVAMALFNAVMDANIFVLLALAIAALVIGFIELYKHSQLVRDIVADTGKVFSAIWNAVWGVLQTVFAWIRDNWPLLVGILFGPFGLVAALILTNWGTVKDFVTGVFNTIINVAQSVWNWLSSNWPLVLAILTGPFGMAVYLIANYWNQIVSFAAGIPGRILGALSSLAGMLVGIGSAMINGLKNGAEAALGGVLGFMGGIIGRIKGALGDTASTLYNAGKAIIDSLGRGIKEGAEQVFSFVSGIAGKIASLKGPPEKDYKLLIPAGTQIMRGLNDSLAAGMAAVQRTLGDVTASINLNSTGWIGGYPPAAAVGRTGPAINIENANFREEVDIDSFMRRAAWNIKTESL